MEEKIKILEETIQALKDLLTIKNEMIKTLQAQQNLPLVQPTVPLMCPSMWTPVVVTSSDQQTWSLGQQAVLAPMLTSGYQQYCQNNQ
jgi:hypothetical protein